MKCPKCGGKGLYNHVADYYVRCNKCNGTGKIEQDNEQWFCSLSTKEKAKVLSNIDDAVVYNWATNDKSRGMSIYFPFNG